MNPKNDLLSTLHKELSDLAKLAEVEALFARNMKTELQLQAYLILLKFTLLHFADITCLIN